MIAIFLTLSAVLTVASAIPYIIDVIKKRTKPRIVSWFNWTLLTGIATAAAFADGQIASAILTLAATIETGMIVVLGLRYGGRKFEPFDIFCQIGAICGLFLWIAYNDATIAIIATVLIDFLALLPTLRHSWDDPNEETLSTFALAGLGAIFSFLAVTTYTISGLAYPVYIIFANVAVVVVLLISKQRPASNTSS